MTTACDELVESIRALRNLPEAAGENGVTTQETAGGNGRLRPHNDLIRIDGLLQYAADLNGGEGLGARFVVKATTLH